ncbi:unnamed protein product [Caenorhabditis angaria]|uniref:Histone-lysine N-methyltransferase, H3 lysine-79 specific n=1 Tax=Caenorhabditis angaria TaxID=860376 RepID=A0A9P1INA1_9PELO|nr:unnamed protein product [Caenorhabditis angaria]
MRLKHLSNGSIEFDENLQVINEFADSWNAERTAYVMELAYAIAIPNPEKLNKHYEVSTDETYGEIRLHQLEKLLEHVKLTKSSIFLDIGSGVGQTTIYMALRKKFKKCYGIEISTLPIIMSTVLEEVTKRVFKLLGINTNFYSLKEGDCMDLQFVPIIRECDVIFINDMKFTPELREKITEMLVARMKDGATVITSGGALGLENRRRINVRNINNLKAYFETVKVKGEIDGVSWTSKPAEFWINKLNRKRVQAFKSHGNY